MKMSMRFCAGVLCLVLLVGVGTGVMAGSTEVTVTKTSSKFISTVAFDGTYHWYAYVQELDSGYHLTYYLRQMSPPTILEYGSGPLTNSEASIGTMTASVDVDTTDMAVVGNGGRITLDWTGDELTAMENSGKSTFRTGTTKTISLVGSSTAAATVSGTFLGDGYTGTGGITTNHGKVITQVRD